jgi:hypothetical protein
MSSTPAPRPAAARPAPWWRPVHDFYYPMTEWRALAGALQHSAFWPGLAVSWSIPLLVLVGVLMGVWMGDVASRAALSVMPLRVDWWPFGLLSLAGAVGLRLNMRRTVYLRTGHFKLMYLRERGGVCELHIGKWSEWARGGESVTMPGVLRQSLNADALLALQAAGVTRLVVASLWFTRSGLMRWTLRGLEAAGVAPEGLVCTRVPMRVLEGYAVRLYQFSRGRSWAKHLQDETLTRLAAMVEDRRWWRRPLQPAIIVSLDGQIIESGGRLNKRQG